MDDEFDPTVGGQQLTGQFRSHLNSYTLRMVPGEPAESRVYDFLTSFVFRYQTPKSGDNGEVVMKTVVSIQVDFVSSYERVNPSELTAEELNEFGKTSALVHVWPYFREYCSSALQKMHLPGTLIPLLEIRQAPPPDIAEPVPKETESGEREQQPNRRRKITVRKRP